MNDIEEIKAKLDIVEYISAYVKLKQAGKNYFGLCPFHSEKTPSFSVNGELGIFKCFGCGESGDVISFIRKIEGVEFFEALKIAAEKANVDIKQYDHKENDKFREEKELLLKANNLTSNYYNYVLEKHKAGNQGRIYLKERGINGDLINKFQIGYSTGGYDNLTKFLIKRGYKETDIERWGLVIKKDNRIIDKFRKRIIFPIYNEFGDMVGFSGRTIIKDFKGPKYLNSPETILFKKRNILFGLNFAKESIRKNGFIILVEGQIDVISSIKAGIENIAAPLGTALTEAQLAVVKKYTNKIYFCFDDDIAGEKAAFRAFEMAGKLGFDLYGILLGGYHDVDDVASKDKERWKSFVFDALDPISYLTARISKRVNIDDLDGKLEIVRLIMPLIRNISDEIKKDFYLKELSRLISVDINILYKQFDNSSREVTKPTFVNKKEEVKVAKKSFLKEDYLVAILLQYFTKIKHTMKLIDIDLISKEDNRKIIESLSIYILSVKDSSINAYIASLPEDLRENVEEKLLYRIPDLDDSNERIAEIQATQAKIMEEQTKQKLVELTIAMEIAEKKNDKSVVDKLQKDIQNTLSEIK